MLLFNNFLSRLQWTGRDGKNKCNLCNEGFEQFLNLEFPPSSPAPSSLCKALCLFLSRGDLARTGSEISSVSSVLPPSGLRSL